MTYLNQKDVIRSPVSRNTNLWHFIIHIYSVLSEILTRILNNQRVLSHGGDNDIILVSQN